MPLVRAVVIATALAACAPYQPSPVGYGAGGGPAPSGWLLVDVLDAIDFDGGRVHFELLQSGDLVLQTVRNDYAAPITIAWTISDLTNAAAESPLTGTIVLPAAPVGGAGQTRILSTLRVRNAAQPWYRYLHYEGRFGDPAARPSGYPYALPFRPGEAYRVVQGWDGALSHVGSDRFAVDFGTPEGTPILAARGGLVVATNDAAEGNGFTPEWKSYDRVNFILVLHDDGTLGEYMHLAPHGVRVHAGQRVVRGQLLAASGNTGYSTAPHLHFKVMTAAIDGRSSVSFPVDFLVAPQQVAAPREGAVYRGFEYHPSSALQ